MDVCDNPPMGLAELVVLLVILAVLGSPVWIWLLVRSRKRSNG